MAKQIVFKNIVIEGYRSYVEQVQFNFDTKGLHLIRGVNGSGKTTLFGALIWCLYKINISSTENSSPASWKHRRTKEWRGTRVAVTLIAGEDKYQIVRHIGFKGNTKGVEGENRLMVFKNGVEVSSELYKLDQQAYIDKLLGADGQVAINSLIFGQKMNRIMATKDKSKRELFESMIDVDFIEQANNKANYLISENEIKLSEASREMETFDDRLNNKIEDFQIKKALLKSFKETQDSRVKLIEEEIEGAEETIEKLLHQKTQLLNQPVDAATDTSKLEQARSLMEQSRETMFKYRERYEDSKRDIIDFDRQMTQINITMKKYWKEMDVAEICPYCGGKVDKTKISNIKKSLEAKIKEEASLLRALEQKKGKLEKELPNVQENYEGAKDLYNGYAANYNMLLSTSKGNSEREISISNITVRVEEKREQLKNLKSRLVKEQEAKPPKFGLNDLKDEILELKAKKPELEKRLAAYRKKAERLAWWKKAFGAGGLKAYIFSTTLSMFNEYLKQYTSQFNLGTVSFGIDLEKASKPFTAEITTNDGKVIDYDEISGGQKTRIDIAVAFAMFDMVAATSGFSMVMFDEPLSSLDDEGKEIVIELIKQKSKSRAVYLIEHDNNIDISDSVEITISGSMSENSTIES